LDRVLIDAALPVQIHGCEQALVQPACALHPVNPRHPSSLFPVAGFVACGLSSAARAVVKDRRAAAIERVILCIVQVHRSSWSDQRFWPQLSIYQANTSLQEGY
jgi:hypothetical protein